MIQLNFNRCWEMIQDWVKNHLDIVLLGLGLIVGLVFVFAVPPWLHYDEPGHLEYAWLIANQPGLPKRGDYDQQFRRQVAASIIETDVEGYTVEGMTTDPLQIDKPIDIFPTHVGTHPPTYYLLAALPLRLFRHSDVVFQLRLVRLVSLSLFLMILWVGYQSARLLFGEGHPLAWMLPLFLATTPAFVDVMTAANNDVAAVLAFSLFFWASIGLIKLGVNPWRLGALAGSVGLCVLTKNTAWMAVPLSLPVLILAIFKGKRYEKFVWLGLGLGLIVLFVLIFSWRASTPAFYYSTQAEAMPERVKAIGPPVGKAVIAQEAQSRSGMRFFHLLSPQDLAPLGGGKVTLGAWVWADAPTTIPFPGIQESKIIIPTLTAAPTVSTGPRLPFPGSQVPNIATPITINFSPENIQLEIVPQFFAFSVEMPPMGDNIAWIYFPPTTDEGNRVYWDGVVLAPGDYSSAPPPEFDSPNATSGVWGGEAFSNLIKNGSGEAAWPVFSGLVRRLIPERINPSMSGYLSILDFQATAVYFRLASSRIFRTFWAVFGWANVPLLGQKPYRFFFVLTFIYLIGVLVGLIRKSLGVGWRTWLLVWAAVILQTIIVVYRGVGSWFSTTYIPVGRYLYPAILAFGVIFMMGADQLLRLMHQRLKIPRKILYGAFILFQLAIIGWGMISIWAFYHLR